ncbi:sulfite exporter TauE/SafE family protein [Sediminibacterium sp. KACHI17]|uniref:Probable membrane transporter protein n=1 Tax=Sediminibacterium sp. KACHI17 TaxID=1751071 RepID=A0AAT9GFU7_9BACT
MDIGYIFFILLFIVAFLYASVGHGGASGYLALMVLFSVTPEVMKPTALLLNLFVSLTAFLQFYRGKHFVWKVFFPLALASVPMAFLGGLITIDALIYKKILGVLLLFSVIKFLLPSKSASVELRPFHFGGALIMGGVIGLLSGMIGIGGGIILSPLLLLFKWTDQKQTAAISALFIFVNSASGLMGQLTNGIQFSADMYGYVAVAFAGGLGGAYFGAMKFKQSMMQKILAVVLAVASYKLLFTAA